MSGILEVYLLLVIGKNIKNNSGTECILWRLYPKLLLEDVCLNLLIYEPYISIIFFYIVLKS